MGRGHKNVQAEVQEAEAEHAEWEAKYGERERELQQQQKQARSLAASLKDVLEERREREKQEYEMQELGLERWRNNEEARAAAPPNGLGPRMVSHAIVYEPLPPVPAEH